MVARALHDMGRRRDGKFVTIKPRRRAPRTVGDRAVRQGGGDAGKLIDADGGTCSRRDRRHAADADAAAAGDRRLGAARQSKTAGGRTCGSSRPQPRPARTDSAGLFREDLFFRSTSPRCAAPLRDPGDDIPDLRGPSCCAPTARACRRRPSTPRRWTGCDQHPWPVTVASLKTWFAGYARFMART